jgi:predicted negative regulator of RcsB-dependent stress response
VDRLTRKELKTDAFAQQVTHTVEYLSERRKQLSRYGIIALIIVLLGGGFYYYRQGQQGVRERTLFEAMRIQEAGVGPSTGRETILTFPTLAEKNKAASKAFSDIVEKYPGSREAIISQYFLGTIAVDDGRLNDAVKSLQEVVSSGNANYSSLAKLSLAEVYDVQGKDQEAEKLLRSLIEKPTVFVSKAQATIALARVLSARNPDEARKLLEPLRTQPGAVSRVALTVLAELPKKELPKK